MAEGKELTKTSPAWETGHMVRSSTENSGKRATNLAVVGLSIIFQMLMSQ